jgi:signal transduction histidine kinase
MSFSIIVAIFYSLITFYKSKSDFLSSVIDKIELKYQERESVLVDFIKNKEYFLNAFKKDRHILESLESKNYIRISHIFHTVLSTRKDFFKLRVIGLDGKELVNVSKDHNGNVKIIEQEKLQDKSSRYYYKQSLSLKKDEVYISKIDLNMEHGKIIKPNIQVIRLLTPIFINGKKVAFLVLTVSMKKLLDSLAKTTLYNLYIIDKNGDFILHKPNFKTNIDYSFSKYLDLNYSLESHFEYEYSNILKNSEYKTDKFFSKKISLDSQDGIKIVLEVKDDLIKKQENKILKELMISLFIVIVISLPFIFVLSNIFENIRLKLENSVKDEEEKNRQKDKMLLQSSKLAIMGEMISMIAHQWKQPLASQRAILGSIKLKRRLGKLDNTHLEDSLELLDNLAVHMNSTIMDFSNFFKPNKDKKTFFIDTIINDSLSLLSNTMKLNSIEIDIKVQDNFKLHTFDGELKQVLLNIINNAKDALVENNINTQKIITISIFVKDNRGFIQVDDNAGGISDDIIDKIFEPYFSTKSKNGTGLGLYMSKVIVDEHLNGVLSVQNSDIGARFIIELDIL